MFDQHEELTIVQNRVKTKHNVPGTPGETTTCLTNMKPNPGDSGTKQYTDDELINITRKTLRKALDGDIIALEAVKSLIIAGLR
jgi:hypothetical protein